MSKPEFSRPFNLDHARAGASYCCRDGRAAQILKWDRSVSDYPLLGIIGKSDDPRTWAITGSTTYGNHGEEYDCDLVMLPLGFIDGQPVFVGDEFIGHANTPCLAKPNLHSNFAGCSWPVPTPMYPTFDGSIDMLSIEYSKNNNYSESLVRVANFALRHAIDMGQVVLPSIAPSDDLLMKIAEAVQLACSHWTATQTNNQAKFIITQAMPDLAAIIASVTGAKDAKEGAQ